MRITIESRYRDVAVLGRVVRALCLAHGMERESVDRAELCAVEAANNCVRHAYRGRADGEVTLVVLFLENGVRLTLSDRGRPLREGLLDEAVLDALEFDPEDLDAVPDRGLGLAIIRASTSSASYRSAGGVNSLTLEVGPLAVMQDSGE